MTIEFLLRENIIPPSTALLGYVGSLSHGTWRPNTDPNSTDDKDIQGVCIAPIETYFGLQNFEQKIVQKDEWDSCVYEIRKYFRLLLNSNPNVMSLLWLEPHHYIFKSKVGQAILDNRDLFVSKQAHKSFNGYAFSQLQNIERGVFNGRLGARRKALYEKHGFDGKHAAHCIRLLRMGIEYLTEGKLHVLRPDAPELITIKDCQWTLEQVKDEARRLFALSDEAYVRSPLPNQPDRDGAERLLVNILRDNVGAT